MIYLELIVGGNQVDGDGTAPDYGGQIEIESFDWKLKAEHIYEPDGRDMRTQVTPRHISLSKYVDPATPNVYAAHDQQLTTAPAYQTGPAGSFYLPTSSPLWNAGSRTAAEAGLFCVVPHRVRAHDRARPDGALADHPDRQAVEDAEAVVHALDVVARRR